MSERQTPLNERLFDLFSKFHIAGVISFFAFPAFLKRQRLEESPFFLIFAYEKRIVLCFRCINFLFFYRETTLSRKHPSFLKFIL